MRSLRYRAVARIALDIDSTLHHYWDLLERIAMERFGVALPYAEQRGWGIDGLERDQLIAAVEETHSDENIESAEPYEGAVEAVRALARGRALDPRDQPPPGGLRAGHPPLAGGHRHPLPRPALLVRQDHAAAWSSGSTCWWTTAR